MRKMFWSVTKWHGGAAMALACALPAAAQYPGQIKNPDSGVPTLRAVAVLEWTGDADHPKASRLVPICVYDGQELQDAGIYMSRPAPIALESEVEYQLQDNGRPVALFDVGSAGRQQDSWVGFGKRKPLPKPRQARVVKIDEDDSVSDVPILHRKHRQGGGASSSGSGEPTMHRAGDASDSDSAPAPDPDRPTLHKNPDATGKDASGGTGSSVGNDSNDPALHRTGDAPDNSASSTASDDPDRPVLHKSSDSSSNSGDTAAGDSSNTKPKKKKKEEDVAYVDSVANATDPDRPQLRRGKLSGYDTAVLPSLIGLPADLQQQVAVSDIKDRPVHPWVYSWANPDDQETMKEEMEDLARTELGLNPPPVPATPPAKKSTTRKSAKTVTPPAEPAPLDDEQFRVFELAYGSGATMVFSARTGDAGQTQKFVTLIAQPDLYGHVAVLLKSVTDSTRLDETPRMRLVDAVDAMADNRGELLFELRGATERQFALYRVLRGQATRLFLTSSEAIASTAGNR
jgi:hypothetical protein